MDIGVPELLIILVIVFLIFGAGKLPEVGSALGKSIREFKKAKDGVDEPKKLEAKAEAKPPESKTETSAKS